MPGEVCARAGEGFFTPTAIGLPADMPGVHAALLATVELCDLGLREELLANIVLVGGGSLLDGFAERFRREVEGALREAG